MNNIYENKTFQRKTGMVNEKLSDFIKKEIQSLKKCFGLIYKYDEFIIIPLSDINTVDLNINSKNFIEARFFSNEGELYLWKNMDKKTFEEKISYRTFLDDTGDDEINYYDEEHIIFGTKLIDGKLYEEQIQPILSPLSDINENDLPVKYKVRNYFEYDDNGFIQFQDSRLVNFSKKGDE